MPENAILQALLHELGESSMSSTLILPCKEEPLTDPNEIRKKPEYGIYLVIGRALFGLEPRTIVSFGEHPSVIIRQGLGNLSLYLLYKIDDTRGNRGYNIG